MEFHSAVKRNEIMTLAGKQTELGMIIGEGRLRKTSATCFPSDAEPRSKFIYMCVYIKMYVHVNTHTQRECD